MDTNMRQQPEYLITRHRVRAMLFDRQPWNPEWDCGFCSSLILDLADSSCPHCGGRSEPICVDLTYDVSDPYAFTFEFHPNTRRTVKWIWGRDMLREGLVRPAGVGDIQLRPHRSNTDVTVLRVESPDGRAVFHFNRDDLVDWVDEIFELVPEGTEKIDWDSELDLLAPDRRR
ncbi:MAG: SsgA family sporulation/cell division regulator [Candidatus Dormibacteria bacterium]